MSTDYQNPFDRNKQTSKSTSKRTSPVQKQTRVVDKQIMYSGNFGVNLTDQKDRSPKRINQIENNNQLPYSHKKREKKVSPSNSQISRTDQQLTTNHTNNNNNKTPSRSTHSQQKSTTDVKYNKLLTGSSRTNQNTQQTTPRKTRTITTSTKQSTSRTKKETETKEKGGLKLVQIEKLKKNETTIVNLEKENKVLRQMLAESEKNIERIQKQQKNLQELAQRNVQSKQSTSDIKSPINRKASVDQKSKTSCNCEKAQSQAYDLQLKVLYELDKKIKYMEMLAAKLALFSGQGQKEKVSEHSQMAQEYRYLQHHFQNQTIIINKSHPQAQNTIIELLMQ